MIIPNFYAPGVVGDLTAGIPRRDTYSHTVEKCESLSLGDKSGLHAVERRALVGAAVVSLPCPLGPPRIFTYGRRSCMVLWLGQRH